MEPITVFLIIFGSALFLAIWPWIRQWVTESLIPWVGEKWNDKIADLLIDVVNWLDDCAIPARNSIKKAWIFIKTRILKIETTYHKETATTGVRSTESIIATIDGKIVKRVEEEEVSWDELPRSMRSEMIRQNSTKGTIDLRDAFLNKFEEKAKEEGLVLEMSVAK
jgi:hypothetical protein